MVNRTRTQKRGDNATVNSDSAITPEGVRTRHVPRFTGALLVGGASARFGSPKALAHFGRETLAQRAWAVLEQAADEVLAFGKDGELPELPFPLLDDGIAVRAPIAGVVAALRAAANDIVVAVPVDCPLLQSDDLHALAAACKQAAVPPSGPLPGAYHRSTLPVLERRLALGRLSLRRALREFDVAVVDLDSTRVANANTRAELTALERCFRP